MVYILLIFTLCIDVLAACLMKTQVFGKWSLLAPVFLYGLSFYCRIGLLKMLPMGVIYALGSGIGLMLSVFVGVFIYKQFVDTPAFVGMSFILIGVAVMCVFSKAV